MTPQEYVNSLNLDYKAEFIPQSQSRNAGEKNPSLNWRVTVGPITCDYMQGCGHIPNYNHNYARIAVYDDAVRQVCKTGKTPLVKAKNAYDACKSDNSFKFTKPIPRPKLTDVLWSLVMDAEAIEYSSFEEWAETYGYDTDSREAEKIYQQCLQIGLKLRQIINLDEAREVFQDY